MKVDEIVDEQNITMHNASSVTSSISDNFLHNETDPLLTTYGGIKGETNGRPSQQYFANGMSYYYRSLKWYEKLSFGLGNAINDLTAAMWFSYLLLFLQVILGVPALTAGFLIFFGQIVDGLSTPVLGVVTDKYLSRKTWYYIGVFLILMSFPLIFIGCPYCTTNYTWMIFYFCTVIAIFQIGWAMVQIAHLSMIPDIPGPDLQRTELTTVRYMVSVVASIGFYTITWLVIHIGSNNPKNITPSDLNKFKEIAGIVTISGLICSIIFYVGMRNYRENVENRRPNQFCERFDTITKTLSIFLSPIIYQVSFLYVAARLFLIINLIYMPLFLDERQAYLPPESPASQEAAAENIAGVPLVSYIASFCASIVLKYFVKQFGNKVVYLVGCILGIAACLWIFMLQPQSPYLHVYMSALLLGAGSAITLVTSLSLTADYIGTNNGQGGFVYSVVTFMDKLLTGIVVVIIEQMKCETRTMCPEYYRYTFVYICGGSCLLGCLFLLSLLPVQF